MTRWPTILAAILGSGPFLGTALGQVPPPLPGRGEAERTSPSVQGLTTRPAENPRALSGPDAPVRIAPGSRVDPDRRPDPKTPDRPATAGPDPLTILNQPPPLIPVDASIEDRNALDTSLRVLSPQPWYPTGFRAPYEHPDDPSYSVRIDGALMMVYQDGVYTRRGGRTVVGVPPGAWYVIGREDLRPRIRTVDPPEPAAGDGRMPGAVAPVAAPSAARTEGVRLDLRVIPVRPAPPVVAPAPSAPGPVDPTVEAKKSGLRILEDEAYRRRLLDHLRGRFGDDERPVTSPAGS